MAFRLRETAARDYYAQAQAIIADAGLSLTDKTRKLWALFEEGRKWL